jgi:glutamate synthase domain-containing protein 2/rubredoxin
MTRYRCDVCNVFEYDPVPGEPSAGIPAGSHPVDLPGSWECPICGSDRTHIRLLSAEPVPAPDRTPEQAAAPPGSLSYPARWARHADSLEATMADIHAIAVTGQSIIEPMRTLKPAAVSWDDILVLGAQIARLPVEATVPVNTRTVIGPAAVQPLVIETPLFVTHMSFGALSREVKIALAKGSAAVRTAIGSGEGGILPEERQHAYRYILEYVPNRYSITRENLRAADAIEIKIGQSVEPGLGAMLPGEKVTEEIGRIRGFSPGTDILSPATYDDIRTPADLKEKIRWLREESGGRPVGVKIAAGHIEEDLDAILPAGPDFVTIDGRPGASGAAPRFIKDSTSVPTIYALHRARKHLDRRRAEQVSLVVTGGLRISPDFAKALALGADAIALGTAALIACACQQYRICHTGRCPVGVTTQDPELRARLDPDAAAQRLANFLRVSTDEVARFARLCGHTDVHTLSLRDLCTTSREIAEYTDIPHV